VRVIAVPYHLDEHLPGLDFPLRLLTGYRPDPAATRLGLRPVPEREVLPVGARDLDPPVVSYLEHAPIRRRVGAGPGGTGLASPHSG